MAIPQTINPKNRKMPCDKSKMVTETGNISQREFELMTKTEQVCHLFKSGEEILFRNETGYAISLYMISGFFVEVWYESPDKKIEEIEVVSPKWVMKNYENQIDLDEMF